MGRAGLSGGCRPLRNPALTTTYYYARTSGGSPKRRHEPPMDAAGDGLVEDAGEDSRPGRAEVGGPRLQRGAQAEVRILDVRYLKVPSMLQTVSWPRSRARTRGCVPRLGVVPDVMSCIPPRALPGRTASALPSSRPRRRARPSCTRRNATYRRRLVFAT